MTRLTENLLLLMVGAAVAIVAIGGNYTRYVKPSLFGWLIAAAVLIVTLALTALVRDARRRTRGSVDAGPDDGHSHGGHRHSASIAWMLVLPAVLLVLVPAPALRAPAASAPDDQVSGWHRHAFAPLPDGPAPDVRLTEVLVRMASDTTGSLDGRTITVTGFTVRQGDRVDLGRFYIICCAADARLRRLEITGPAAHAVAGYPDETWVSVRGRVAPGPTPSAVPRLIATGVQPAPEPRDPYDYPS